MIPRTVIEVLVVVMKCAPAALMLLALNKLDRVVWETRALANYKLDGLVWELTRMADRVKDLECRRETSNPIEALDE